MFTQFCAKVSLEKKNQTIVKERLALEEEWTKLAFENILQTGKQSPSPESFMVISCLTDNVIRY